MAREADKPADTGPEVVGRPAPVRGGACTEEDVCDLAVAGVGDKGIMHAQYGHPSHGPEPGAPPQDRKAAGSPERVQASQREELSAGGMGILEMTPQAHGPLQQGTCPHVKSQMMSAVAKHQVLVSIGRNGEGRSPGEPVRIEIPAPAGQGFDRKNAGIESGVPDDPGQRRRPVGVFRESAPPSAR
jgi:hypothetical protein